MTHKSFLIGAAAVALAGQAQVAHARVAHICPTLNTATNELNVRINSGCMSSSTSYASDNLALEVDQNYAVIRVTGEMQFNSGGPIQTADCGGAKDITLTAKDVEQRRYYLSYADQPATVVDLIENPAPQDCIGVGPGYGGGSEDLAFKTDFKDWNDNPRQGWQDWRGSSVLGMLAPILDGHPEGEEGRPFQTIEMKKMQWKRQYGDRVPQSDYTPFIAVNIVQHGYLDDSVSGGRYFAEVRMDETGQWKLTGFWSQQMCARGQNAGQWTAKPCL